MVAVGTPFNDFSYEVDLAENQTNDERIQRYIRGFVLSKFYG